MMRHPWLQIAAQIQLMHHAGARTSARRGGRTGMSARQLLWMSGLSLLLLSMAAPWAPSDAHPVGIVAVLAGR